MRGVAITCFFLSGASGLIFQVIWTRMFSLVFGATALAISTVVAAFMGGLALGSFFAGRFADRIRDPLRAYALAEVGVGLCALALPLAVGHFDALNRLLYEHFADRFFVLSLFRFLAAAALIVVPTTLMGATLPLLSRYFIQTQGEHARVGLRVGTLYAVNTTGAVIGAALGGFVLLPSLGLATTNLLAAATNLVLGAFVAGAYLVQRRRRRPPPADPELAELLDDIAAVPAAEVHISPRVRRVAIVAFAASGAAAMVYQVLWSRALTMAIGSSVYSFTIVLTAFLIGLAAGAALVGRLSAASKDPIGLLALNHLAIVVFVGASYLILDKLGHLFISFVGQRPLEATRIMWSQLAVTMLAILPATVAMGGIFPLTIRVCSAGLDRVGRDVGTAYSMNTVGAILGSFSAGFIVIPVLQLQPGIYAAACVSLTIAVVLAFFASSWRPRGRVAVAACAVLLAVAGPLLPRWNLHHVSAGVFRPTIAREVMKTGQWEAPKLVYYRDGVSTTVSVEQWSEKHFSLKNNGKVDASTGDDMPTQINVGLLPLLLHPRAPSFRPEVALIGYASGVSAGAILQFPVRRLDVVELEPAIFEASRFFEHVNHRPPADRRTRIFADDGRNFLAARSERYDVIVNEPSNPWISGVSNLFTRDYFEIGRRRLKPDGIFCTWAQLYEMAPRRVKSIYRAFASVFPHVYAFSATNLSSDTFLIGTNRPLDLDIRRLRRAFEIPTVRAEFARANVKTPDDLVALTLLTPRELHAFIVGAAVNTDDNALVEFAAPRDLYNHKRYDAYISNVYGRSWIYGDLRSLIRGYRTSGDYATLVRSLLSHGKFREGRRFAKRVDAQRGGASRAVLDVLSLLDEREVLDPEFALTDEGPPLEPPRGAPGKKLKPELANRLAREYREVEQRVAHRDYKGALDMIEDWPEDFLEHAGCDFSLLWSYVAYKTGNFHQAVNILEDCRKDAKVIARRPTMLYYFGRVSYGNADFREAVKSLEAWAAHRRARGLAVNPPPFEPDPDEHTTLTHTQATAPASTAAGAR